MALKKLEPCPLPNRWQSRLDKLLNRLGACRAILESLPAIDHLTFRETTHLQQTTISLYLGQRKQSNGTQTDVWATLLPRHKQMKPPVVFVDEVQELGRVVRYPRAATSLLRTADELQPPFCFLQFDTYKASNKIRDMLCALVLYQYLAAGLDNCAMHWSKFDDSLMNALQYIDNRFEYHYWLENGSTYHLTISAEMITNERPASRMADDLITDRKRRLIEEPTDAFRIGRIVKGLEMVVSSDDIADSPCERTLSGDTTSEGSRDEKDFSDSASVIQDITGKRQALLEISSARPSFFVRLKISSETLTEISGVAPPTRRDMVPDTNDEDDDLELDDSEQTTDMRPNDNFPVLSIEIKSPSQQEDAIHLHVGEGSVEEAGSTGEYSELIVFDDHEASHDGARDSGYVSTTSSPNAALESSKLAPEMRVEKDNDRQEVPIKTQTEDQASVSDLNDRSADAPEDTTEQTAPSLEIPPANHDDAKHCENMIIVLSSSEDEERPVVTRRALFRRQTASRRSTALMQKAAKVTEVVNLCSEDDEDSDDVFIERKEGLEVTPDMEKVENDTPTMTTTLEKRRLRPISERRRGIKRKLRESMVEDGRDDLIEETSGGGWREASQKRSKLRL